MTSLRRSVLELVFTNWTWRLPSDSRAVALTFDDGPDARTTPLLLDTLQNLNIPATWFVIGNRCRSNAETLRSAANAGQVIANHGYEHVNHRTRGPAFQRQSLRATENVLRDIGVNPVRLFRPPFGGFNWYTAGVMRSLGYQGVLWSLMAKDWAAPSDERLKQQLKSRLHEGAIIVLHDAHETTTSVVRLLPWLRDEVCARGWSFASLSHFVSHT